MSVRTTVGVVHLVLVGLGGLAMIGNSVQRYFRTTRTPTAAMLAQTDNEKVLAEIAPYKEWTLVNPTPQKMDPLPSISCARIPGRMAGSPHLHKYISVYVNTVGTDAMMHQRVPVFPEGSIIVKEKLSAPADMNPELLTVMRKREKGYNAASGDWEYLILDGKASSITDRGKIQSCNTCHTAYQRVDYVTRTYLAGETRRELK